MISCHPGIRSPQTNHLNIFSSSDIVNSYYMTLKRCHAFETNKESPSFHCNDDTINVQVFAFLYFLAVNTEFYRLFLRKVQNCALLTKVTQHTLNWIAL